jgi:hypothetical protein
MHDMLFMCHAPAYTSKHSHAPAYTSKHSHECRLPTSPTFEFVEDALFTPFVKRHDAAFPPA